MRAGRDVLLRQNYVQNGGQGRATAQFIVDHQGIIAAIKGLKPGGAQAKRTIVPIEGAGKAFVNFDQTRGVGDIYIFVAGRFYIKINAQNVENRAFLTRILSAWDFAGSSGQPA